MEPEKLTTVREFIQEHPNASLDMMTYCGFLRLTPEQAQEMLRGESVYTHNGFRGDEMEIPAEGILNQEIHSCSQDAVTPELYHMLTDIHHEQAPVLSMQAGGS